MWLFLALIVAPLVELYVIIQVAQVIGGWQTIALLIVESAIGAWLLKHQGLSTLTRVQQAVDAGRVPGKELVDGLLLVVAGALMLAPGFLGDLIGFALIIPITRAPVRALVLRRFRAGSYGTFFASSSTGGGARFIGTFRAGPIYDATGSVNRSPRTGDDGPSGELQP
jgi:UPF0716 protein FxsA